MAGHGPAPKPADRRARKNSDPTALRVIEVTASEQPKLPTNIPGVRNEANRPVRIPAQTRTWWKMWADSPLSDDFTETDWSELLDTAVIHARFWAGDVKLAAELRLRVAKFGATPEDRARLRITFAQADRAEKGPSEAAGAPADPEGSRAQLGPLVGVA
jgi:hypothetical protein